MRTQQTMCSRDEKRFFMCYAKPGPRCSKHARAALEKAWESGDSAKILLAQDDYDETKAGQQELVSSIDRAARSKRRTTELRARLSVAQERRNDKVARYKALQEQYAQDSGSSAVTTLPLDGNAVVAPQSRKRTTSPERARIEAVKALKNYSDYLAGFHDADHHEIERTIRELRVEYNSKYAHLDADKRPDPPQEWASTLSSAIGGGKLPSDLASRYALYRASYDPSLFAQDSERRYAVLDVETAEEDFQGRPRPANGSIIEVGIVEYDAQGNETERWGALIHPGHERAARIGTGAVEVHGITMEDVRDAPQWDEVVGEVRSRLDGRTFVAHNASFDSAYIGHHVYGEYRTPLSVIDTLAVSRFNNGDMPDHKLATVASRHGVVYDNGHRAVHDAVVCGEVFFAMKRKMHQDWEQSQCARIVAENA